jgi:hypothetical protein
MKAIRLTYDFPGVSDVVERRRRIGLRWDSFGCGVPRDDLSVSL